MYLGNLSSILHQWSCFQVHKFLCRQLWLRIRLDRMSHSSMQKRTIHTLWFTNFNFYYCYYYVVIFLSYQLFRSVTCILTIIFLCFGYLLWLLSICLDYSSLCLLSSCFNLVKVKKDFTLGNLICFLHPLVSPNGSILRWSSSLSSIDYWKFYWSLFGFSLVLTLFVLFFLGICGSVVQCFFGKSRMEQCALDGKRRKKEKIIN